MKRKKVRSMAQIIHDAQKYGHTIATREEMAIFNAKVAHLAHPVLKHIQSRRLEPTGNLILD